MKKIDLLYQRFGRLVVVDEAQNNSKSGESRWICFCDCGGITITKSYDLRSKHTQSCGCLRKERVSKAKTIHGHSYPYPSPTYISWSAMKSRCGNPKNNRYSIYGGRGIKVCFQWEKFENFLSDMGERPDRMCIDRIDNDGNYEPDNCQWATYGEQRVNQRRMKP